MHIVYIYCVIFMGFPDALIGVTLIMIVLAVFVPVTAVLLPTIIGDSGAAVGMMVSTIIVVILACTLFVFMKQSMSNNNSMQGMN